ncbi:MULTISPECIES: outer membrane protein assembly factor [Anaeromyxobacter]|uniref:BamA/OMP85 family outer membrane protein n=1 Tax=Anaeromyxobacter TaxID=161492 RepID=UPI001F5A3C02|nr:MULTISPECIES: BamA/TamA family outer membrane protein [unclassified Anaeromyxobacter]
MVRRAAPALVVLVALLALGASGCLRGRGTASEPIVTKVELTGVKALDAADIKAKLATQEPAAPPGVTGLVARQGFRLDPDALAVDRRRIEAYYRERGYYEARVEEVKVLPDGRGRVRVELRISEGKPVHVTEVRVTGLDDAPDARKRLEKLPLEVGEVFRVSDYDRTKGAITSALRTTGWANAEVKQSAQVLPLEGTAQVTYEVTPGRRFRFGPIFVAGTAAVSRDLIREQASIDVTAGDWFDDSKLPKAQARVFDLGVFAGVRVTRGTPNVERGIIPVVVAVREAPFRTIRAGPGLGIEATRWEARANAGWQHRNFLGDLRKVGVELRAGYAWLPTPWARQREGIVGQLGLEYQQPAAIARRIDVSSRVELERGLEAAYAFWSERVQLGLPVRIAPRWTFVPSYNLEVYQLSRERQAVVTPTPGLPDVETRPLLVGCPSSVCLLSYLEQRFAWDGRNDPVNTRRGYYVGLSVQEGFRIVNIGYRYLRLLPEVRGFWPLSRSLVLGARARVGALVPLAEPGTPPIVARFYAGGPISMRGYYTRRMSPMVQDNNKDWVPIGGNGLVDGSIELRYAISGSWGGTVFVDGANVAAPSASRTEWRTVLDPRDVQLAAGAGLRYGTQLGPIGVDVGMRLPTDFSAGVPFNHRFPAVPSNPSAPREHREPIVAVHITIGEAF